MRILVAEAIADKGIELLRAEAEVDVTKVSPEELLRIIPEYDAVITRSETRITADVVAAGSRLKVVGRAGVGFDNIDVAAATERGIVVVNVPGGNTISTAEHTMALILSLMRHVPQAMASLKAGKWERKNFVGLEVFGKTLGIIGLGRIGGEVAARARAFGMNLIAFDPYANPVRAEQLGVQLVPLNTLLQEADVVTIHAAKTSESAHLIRAKELALMKPGARIVNCARGGMVDEEALYRALKEGWLAGAALDVFSVEPITDHPLFSLPNVIITPHLAASTLEAQEANGVVIAQQVLRVLRGELVPDAVNLPAVPPDAAATIVGHLPLAGALGAFIGQAFGGHAAQIEVSYHGELAKEPTALLTNMALRGFLTGRVAEHVNYINAPTVAKRYGVSVKESKVEGSPVTQIVVRAFVGRDQERVVAGALELDGGMRFLSVNGMRLDMTPSRHLLVTRHNDRPGMLGQFGTILGKWKVNIAGLALGRQTKAGEAVAVFVIDEAPSKEAVEEIAAVDGIIEARAVMLPMIPNGV